MIKPLPDKQWGMAPDKAKALFLCKKMLPEFVCDAVNLEGIDITLPEIQTLLDGITVGGHSISDQQIALNQINAWRLLFDWVERDHFELTVEKTCSLHALAAKEEALIWGEFRSGSVRITGTQYLPPPADRLPELFDQLVNQAETSFLDIYDRAIFFFLEMARNQFFYDVNKRMGRFMMNGILLQAGFPAINIPARRSLEFHQKMLNFYSTHNHDEMNSFVRSCNDERIIEIMREPPVTKKPKNGPTS